MQPALRPYIFWLSISFFIWAIGAQANLWSYLRRDAWAWWQIFKIWLLMKLYCWADNLRVWLGRVNQSNMDETRRKLDNRW